MLELTGELAMESDDIEGLEAAKTRFQLFGMRGGDWRKVWFLSNVKDGDVIGSASEDTPSVFDTVDGSEIRRENHLGWC